MFLNWKSQYCENGYTTQDNICIQCNPHQITNGIFHRTRTKKKNLKICMETQKTTNIQSNLKKEKWNWRNRHLTSDYTTKLQLSKQYGAVRKTEIKTNGAGWKAQK